jgi:vacuolar-type H+-ATPase subunit I/STV1
MPINMSEFKNKGSYYFSQEEMAFIHQCMKTFIPNGNTFPTMSKLIVNLMDTMSKKIVYLEGKLQANTEGTDSLLLENEQLKTKISEYEKGMQESNTELQQRYETEKAELQQRYETEKAELQEAATHLEARVKAAEKLLAEKGTIRLGAGEVIIKLPDETIFKVRKVRKFAKEKGFIKTDDPTEFINVALLEFLRVHFYNIVNID